MILNTIFLFIIYGIGWGYILINNPPGYICLLIASIMWLIPRLYYLILIKYIKKEQTKLDKQIFQ